MEPRPVLWRAVWGLEPGSTPKAMTLVPSKTRRSSSPLKITWAALLYA